MVMMVRWWVMNEEEMNHQGWIPREVEDPWWEKVVMEEMKEEKEVGYPQREVRRAAEARVLLRALGCSLSACVTAGRSA
jgi:hypothetical protein